MSLHTQAAPAIDTLRGELDQIDADLLSLMERRLSLARGMAAAKASTTDDLLLRPDREERVVARLAARSTCLPEASIAVIWRELMALNLQAQRRTRLVIHAVGEVHGIAARASARFGASAPVVHAVSPSEALATARSGQAIAVIELDQPSGWWRALADHPELRIIDELRGPGGRGTALAVGRVAREHLARGRRWEVVEEAELVGRICAGETICPLAAAGSLRLCVVENVAPSVRVAA